MLDDRLRPVSDIADPYIDDILIGTWVGEGEDLVAQHNVDVRRVLDLLKKEEIKIPQELRKLIEERETARKNKDWKKSDELRDKIKESGYLVEDTPNGQKIKKN